MHAPCSARHGELESLLAAARSAQAAAVAKSSPSTLGTATTTRTATSTSSPDSVVSGSSGVTEDSTVAAARDAESRAFAVLRRENEELRGQLRHLMAAAAHAGGDTSSVTAVHRSATSEVRTSSSATTAGGGGVGAPQRDAGLNVSHDYQALLDRAHALERVVRDQATTLATYQSERERVQKAARRYEVELSKKESVLQVLSASQSSRTSTAAVSALHTSPMQLSSAGAGGSAGASAGASSA
ncbi:hypothetical protein EON68_02235 [archaeon]|nr:MAG: hypothetical protein EON68_02235 [archaeon]